jgi:hypothetical protein
MYRFCHDKPWARSTRGLPFVERAAVWLQFYCERFTLICEDLLQMANTKIIADGVDLLPEMVKSITPNHYAAWLVPTREFFDQHYFTREWVLEDEDQSDHIWSYYQVLINHHTNVELATAKRKYAKKCRYCVGLYLGNCKFVDLEDGHSGARTPSQGQEPAPAKRHLGSPIQRGREQFKAPADDLSGLFCACRESIQTFSCKPHILSVPFAALHPLAY